MSSMRLLSDWSMVRRREQASSAVRTQCSSPASAKLSREQRPLRRPSPSSARLRAGGDGPGAGFVVSPTPPGRQGASAAARASFSSFAPGSRRSAAYFAKAR